MMDLFLTNMHLFTSRDDNWWTGVVWIIVMFLSAVWTLILTAPIHCRGSITEQVTSGDKRGVMESPEARLVKLSRWDVLVLVLKSKWYCEGFVVTPSCSLVLSRYVYFLLIASPACLHLGDCITNKHSDYDTPASTCLCTGTRLFVSQTSGWMRIFWMIINDKPACSPWQPLYLLSLSVLFIWIVNSGLRGWTERERERDRHEWVCVISISR